MKKATAMKKGNLERQLMTICETALVEKWK